MVTGLTQPESAAFTHMSTHIDMVTSLVTYGPSRDVMLLKEETVVARLEATQLTTPAHFLLPIEEVDRIKETAEWNFTQSDYTARVRMWNVLLRLDPSVPAHVAFAIALLKHVLDMYLGMRVETFSGTIDHRIQLRLWCTIHTLLGFVTAEEAPHILPILLQALKVMATMSTRYYIEFAVTRLVVTYPSLGPLVYTELSDFKIKPFMAAGLLTTILHIAPYAEELHQPSLIKMTIEAVLPWITSNHFTVRVYAQFVIETLASLCAQGPPTLQTLLESYHLNPLVSFFKTNPDSLKFHKKCQALYFVGGGFHPLHDVTVDFIFRGCMTVGEAPPDERISVQAFLNLDASPGLCMPVVRTEGQPERVGDSVVLDRGQSLETIMKPRPEETTVGSVQKKVVPWETLLTDIMEVSQQSHHRGSRTRNPLVVVASLIDRLPNLGGLCRTGEIFNAQTLVVHDESIKNDAIFQSLAVSADSWLPLTQVRPEALKPYLLSMKSNGYKLVGIEQATHSVPLGQFTFPRKCLLLLGNEREGVPPELLPLLDHIVEIPQYGVVRSLNVHVSGALIMWEYAKQHAG